MEDTLENSKNGTGCHSTRLFFTPLLFSSQYFLFRAFSFSIIITKLREAVPAALRIQWLILTHYTRNTSEYSTHGLLGKLSALVLKPSWDAEKFSIFFFLNKHPKEKTKNHWLIHAKLPFPEEASQQIQANSDQIPWYQMIQTWCFRHWHPELK